MFLSPNLSEPTTRLKSSTVHKKPLDDQNNMERRKSFVFNESTLDKGLNHWMEYKCQGKKIQRRSYHSTIFYGNK